MRNVRIPACAFLLLAALFVLLLVSSAPSLPATIATHFNAHGKPNAWMRSSSYLAFFAAFGLGVPAIIVAAFYMVRWLPPGLINIPRRNFWLAAERASSTHRYLLARGLWLASMMLAFLLAVHYAVVQANQLAPAHLAPKSILVPLGTFVIALVIWIITFLRYFARAQATSGES